MMIMMTMMMIVMESDDDDIGDGEPLFVGLTDRADW